MRRHLVGALMIIASASACDTGIHDGPMRQLEGKQIDEAALSEMLRIKARPDDVTRQFGAPTSIQKASDAESWIYMSVRGRTSYRTILGIKHGESTQLLVESWTLQFHDGRLADIRHVQETK